MAEEDKDLIGLEKQTEKLLLDHFEFIYEATRLTFEFNSLYSNYNSLSRVRKNLTDEAGVIDSLKTMDESLDKSKQELSIRKRKLEQQEDLALKQFIEIINILSEYTEKIRTNIKEAVAQHCKATYEEAQNKISSVTKATLSLEEGKMDISAGEAIHTSLEQFKGQMVESQTKNMRQIAANNERSFQEIVREMRGRLDRVRENDAIVRSAVQLIEKEFDTKLNEAVRKNLVEEQKEGNIVSEKILEIIRNEIDRLGPAHLQSNLAHIPEIKQFVEFSNLLLSSSEPMTLPLLISIRDTMSSMSQEMLALRQQLEETQSIVGSMRCSHIYNNAQIDEAATAANMQSIQYRMAVLFNNVKMIETTLNAKCDWTQQIEALSSKKRVRMNDDSNLKSDDITERIEEVERKHQKLLDCIIQYKENVLDDMFPTRLEAAMKKIERILTNHEAFITFIIDPISTKRKVEKVIEEEQYLDPAMIDCIEHLIKKSTSEAAAPLHAQIKSLQEQLSKRS
ncbi:hypothetical protein G6F37_004549 [Rhizopus arrhizus]|nr:hypothetical protein G6F38_004760 [Rhizopus arrhizus]KAG1159819.1 hypothetical protein G6F37_004549 [Rhizopus arrhizus]